VSDEFDIKQINELSCLTKFIGQRKQQTSELD